MDIIDFFQCELAKNLAIKTDRDFNTVSVPGKMPSVDFNSQNMELHTYKPPVDPNSHIRECSAVDPFNLRGYTAMNTRNPDNEYDEDEFEQEEVAALNQPMNLTGFLSSLEEFLDRLPDAKRGNVFLSNTGDGVCVNILVGIAFANADSKVKQINLIIAPTDRALLGSVGTTVNDLVDRESVDEMGKEELRQACRQVGVKYGKLNNDGMREALRLAFDRARDAVSNGF